MIEDAPVFYPTLAEFAPGPINYIIKIRSQAEKYGICKIVPPKSFKPPFAVDTSCFKFTPRVQRLNELEASIRTKLNFLDQLFKFWELQASTIKVPYIENKLLDLHQLHRCVQNEGGFEVCVCERRWSKVAQRMGYQTNAHNRGTLASLLRHHYEKILYPYDIFLSGATINVAVPPPSSTSSHTNNSSSASASSSSSTSSASSIRLDDSPPASNLGSAHFSNNNNNNNNDNISISNRQDCVQCNNIKPSNLLVTCDNCRLKFHITCLIPPLKDMPKYGAWHCHSCLAQLVNKRPKHYSDFGFIPSQRHYSLTEFENMANEFKTNYFKKQCNEIPPSVVEKEYWRLVSSLEDNICVEYGADLHCNDFTSGFPTKTNKHSLDPKSHEYVDHPWNLNNMPIADGSVFKYINTNISGMIVPWMYVGMCFSTFCWHNEDHWTYSINYLHYGEAKTWYGIPGFEAEAFEKSMRKVAPDLFESQPDLLHQLVTICNPSVLIEDKVPIYRVHQFEGEFVVTFPRAYHMGFNQGLNFAEAVNFAPPDWLKLGRDCIDHYSSLKRYPVFSQDELICKMASDPSVLDYSTTFATIQDISKMIEKEITQRADIFDWGVLNSRRHMFENYPDDARQCCVCKTTCFLSALSCQCSERTDSLVCLNHKDKLCDKCKPKNFTLNYRYTLNELPVLLQRLMTQATRTVQKV